MDWLDRLDRLDRLDLLDWLDWLDWCGCRLWHHRAGIDSTGRGCSPCSCISTWCEIACIDGTKLSLGKGLESFHQSAFLFREEVVRGSHVVVLIELQAPHSIVTWKPKSIQVG